MAKSKIAIALDQDVLAKLDGLVASAVYPSRSRAVQAAVEEKLERLERKRLAEECAKLDPEFERALAEEDISEELREWPDY